MRPKAPSLKVCKICLKTRVALPQTLGTKSMRVNQKGQYWQGLTCPDCRPRKTEQRRCHKHEPLGPSEVPNTSPVRFCRGEGGCGKELPPSRYFQHAECESTAEYYDMSDKYGWVV